MKRRGWRRLGRVHVDPERDIDEELRLHLEGRIDEYRAQGLSEGEARERAVERFGSPEAVARACRAAAGTRRGDRGRTGVVTMLEHWVGDGRMALRTLGRRPTFTSAAVITLALAVGACTAVFSVVNGILLRPLPHPDPDALMLVWEVDAREATPLLHNPVTVATFLDWRRQSESFETLAGFGIHSLTLRGEEGPESVLGATVTADFFRVLQPELEMGRGFLPSDDLPASADATAIISHEYWRSHFGGDPGVIGRRLTSSGRREVVGVLGPGFEFMDQRPQVLIPWPLDRQSSNRRSHTLRVIGRLRDGVSAAMAQAEMERITDGLVTLHPEEMAGFGVNVEPLRDYIVGPSRPALVVLMAAVAFVLTIACVNVANLLLTRSLTEERQDALRAALGAPRGRLIRRRLVEALLLALAGGGLGLVLAALSVRVFLALAPASLPRLHEIGLDPVVLGFGLAVSVLVGVTFGLAPAVHAAGVDPAARLREGARAATASRGHGRLRSALAAAQVTLSLILLVSAGLMLQTFARLTRVDPGFRAEGVLTTTVGLTDRADSTRALQAVRWDGLLDRVSAMPGVRQAGLTRFLPFDQGEWTWSVWIEGRPQPPEGERLDYGMHAVSPGYFATMGVQVVRGRDFSAADRHDAPRVALVNQAFVRRFFGPGEDPVGLRFALLAFPEDFIEIVGVVGDTRHHTLDQGSRPAFYLPYDQVPYDWFIREMSLAVRTSGDPTALAPALRREVRRQGADLLVGDIVPMRARIRASEARRRFATAVLSAFAGAALLIAAVGLYGLMAYAVGQRRREIGVRIALGARPGELVSRFLRRGLKTVMPGMILGFVGAYGFARLQAGLLFGVEPLDPPTYLAMAAVLLVAALVATWIPARRAARVDPVEALSAD